MKRLIPLLFALALAGCSMLPPLGEIVHPCSDAHPCGAVRHPKKCTPVQLCGLSADGSTWVCESSDKMGVWPPLCAEDEAKEKKP